MWSSPPEGDECHELAWCRHQARGGLSQNGSAESNRESGLNRPPNSVTPLLPALGELPGNLDEKIAEAVGDDTGAEGSSEHIDVAR